MVPNCAMNNCSVWPHIVTDFDADARVRIAVDSLCDKNQREPLQAKRDTFSKGKQQYFKR